MSYIAEHKTRFSRKGQAEIGRSPPLSLYLYTCIILQSWYPHRSWVSLLSHRSETVWVICFFDQMRIYGPTDFRIGYMQSFFLNTGIRSKTATWNWTVDITSWNYHNFHQSFWDTSNVVQWFVALFSYHNNLCNAHVWHVRHIEHWCL